MTDVLQVVIDLTEVANRSNAEMMEEEALSLADEMSEGGIANSAYLAREKDLPEGAKTGALAFISGVLTAEISRENLMKALGFLGNRFYGKTLTLQYKADGLECSLEYRNEEEIEQALTAIVRLESLRINIKEQ